MTEKPIIPEPTPHTTLQFIPIIFVLLVAFAVRLIGAGHFPVSTDEGWSTWAISEPTFGAITEKLAADRHPPLYFLALGYWSQIAGQSRVALRLPNILFGLLTTAMVFRIGADTFGRTARHGREDVSWYGMLMYALLPSAIYYSQEIRHFGWLVTGVCLSSMLFIRILRTPKRNLLMLYALSVAAMMYVLYFGIWILVVHVLVGMVLWRGDASVNWRITRADRLKLVAAWAGALVLYIPWLIVIFQQQWQLLGSGITAQPWSYNSTLPDLLALLDLLMGGGLALTAGLYVVGLWGSLVSDRTDVTLGLRLANPAWLAELFIVLWGLGLFLLMAILNNFTGLLSARTTVFLSPALMLVVGAGIVRLRIGVRWSLLAGYIGVSLFLPPLIQPRLDYHVAATALAEHYRPGDFIVLETGWDDNAFRYETRLAVGGDATIIRTLPWVNNRDEALPVVEQIDAQLSTVRRVWVVNWLQPSQVMPHLDAGNANYSLVRQMKTHVGDQYVGRFSSVGGSDEVTLTLYARPQLDGESSTFGDILILEDVLFADDVAHGETITLDMWWRAAEAPELDYSLGIFLVDTLNNTVLAESNTALTPDGTSTWTDDTVHYTLHTLTVPDELPTGDYHLEAAVYFFEHPEDPPA